MGGQSRRFQADKAFAVYCDKTFYQQSIRLLEPFANTIYVVKRPDQSITINHDKITIASDIERFRGEGPLAGIYTVMSRASTDWFMVLPVDTPLISASILFRLTQYLHKKTDAVIPIVNGNIQPLIGLYHSDVKGYIEQQLINKDRSMHQLLAKLTVHYVEFPAEDAHFFANINTEEEYHYYIKDQLE